MFVPRTMGETFYGVLGVDRDADAAAIDRAYRDLVVDCHPDVSDDPDAGGRFRRLTIARDVLVDAAERARYDRLGHERYVRHHLDGDVWRVGRLSVESRAVTAAGRPGTTDQDSGRGDGVTRGTASADGVTRQAAWDEDATRQAAWDEDVTRQAVGSDGVPRRPSGGVATAYYRPSEGLHDDPGFSLASLVAMVRRVGVWLAVDSVLIVLSVWTGWLVLVWQSVSPASVVAVTVLLVVTLAIAALHLAVVTHT